MFTFLSALVFSAAFALAVGTIGWMLAQYRDKMMAALLFEPVPRERAACSLHITRRRIARDAARPVRAMPAGTLAA